MKKLLVFLSLSIFLFISFSIQNIFAEERTKAGIMKDIILKKRELENNNSKGELYIKALDAYFEKYQEDTNKIESIVSKVSLAKSKLGNSYKEQEVRLLIEYIEYKAELLGITLINQTSNILSKNTYDFGFSAPSTEREYTTSESEITIRGYTKLKDVSSVEVNGFNLASFNGETWRYHAFVRFETLKPGINKYEVNYYSDTGEILYTDYFIVNYNLDIYNLNLNELTVYLELLSLEELKKLANDLYPSEKDIYELIINTYLYEGLTPPASLYNEDFSSINENDQRDMLSYVIGDIYFKNNPESLDAYSIDAKNSKVSSDIKTLATLTEITLTDGSLDREQILGKETSSWKENIGTIRTGYFNFSGLKQNREDFLDPNNNEYLFAYVINDGNFYYQVLGYTQEENNSIQAVIKGNYIQLNTLSPVSLFMNLETGNYIKNGEIFDSEIMIGYKKDKSDTNSIQTTTEDSNEIKNITGVVTLELKNPHELAGEALNFEVTVEKITKASGNSISNTIEKDDKVEVHYIGTLKNGEEFDSSYDRNQTLPFTAGVGMMISGFDSGVLGMRINETKTLTLLPEEAYGLETIQEEISLVELKSYINSDFDIFVGAVIPTAGGDATVVNIDYD